MKQSTSTLFHKSQEFMKKPYHYSLSLFKSFNNLRIIFTDACFSNQIIENQASFELYLLPKQFLQLYLRRCVSIQGKTHPGIIEYTCDDHSIQ